MRSSTWASVEAALYATTRMPMRALSIRVSPPRVLLNAPPEAWPPVPRVSIPARGALGPRRPSGGRQHSLEGHPGPPLDLGVDGDLVVDLAVDQALEDPGQVGGVDPEHGRARADQGVEARDLLVRVGVGEPLHEVDLGGDPDGRTGRRGFDGP